MTDECTRCGRDVKFSFTADDGTLMYMDPSGYLTCEEFIEWDEDNELRPAHTITEVSA